MKKIFNWSLPLSMSKDERKLHGISQTLTKLYRCRDLEINNLWQRSIFLAVFLTLALSGYGALIVKSLNNSLFFNSPINIAAILLAVIGIIFSTIWIMMGKASKAWYEVYENAITKYEKEYWEELGIPPSCNNEDTNFRMGMMPPAEIVDKLTSTKAGAYSPSKLNIIIGQVSWLIWVVVYIVHAFILSYVFFENILTCNNLYIQILISAICSSSIYFIVLLTNLILKKKARSGFLNGE